MREQEVLDLLRSEGPLTRAEIARQCRLSKPTVSALAQTLLEAELIREEGQHASNAPGRPGRLLAFEPSAGYVIGMDVGGSNVRGQLADLEGTPVAEADEATESSDVDRLVVQITRIKEYLLRQHSGASERLKAIAIGTPGVVDPASHRVRYAPNLPALEHPEFLTRLAASCEKSVRVCNDVNLAAVGEASLPATRDLPDFVFVSIGTGLGFALVREGRVYEGSAGRAGELGYLPYPPGSSTTIESFVSGPGISRVHRLLGGSGRARDALDEADRGERPGSDAIDRFLSDLTWLLMILSTLLDPHQIILGGGIGIRCQPYLVRLQDALETLSPIRPTLTLSGLGARAGLIGAVRQALNDCRSIEQLLKGGNARIR